MRNTQIKVDLPDDVVLRVDNVSKKFCRNLKRSLWYGVTDLARNFIGGGKDIHSVPSSDLSAVASAEEEAGGEKNILLTTENTERTENTPSFHPSSFIPYPSDDGLRPSEFWALKNISFDLKRGEVLGIIGQNGSGKSTLLRVLTGIFPPDGGLVAIKGRIGALIALGAGFHPHLTGRENVFLNGAILGIPQYQIKKKFEQIADFADIGDFLDAPVATYSSGMRVRLGFSVAIYLEPEIMFIDEVLAVGDVAFRVKCNEKMQEYRDQGNSICLVSHDMMGIEDICDRILWIDGGYLKMDGNPSAIISAYRQGQHALSIKQGGVITASGLDELGDIAIERMETLDDKNQFCKEFRYRQTLIVRIHYHAKKEVKKPYFMIYIGTKEGSGYLMCANMLRDGYTQEYVKGRGYIDVDFGPVNLYPDLYRIRGMIRKDSRVEYFASRTLGSFSVISSPSEYGCKGDFSCYVNNGFVTPIKYRWNGE